MCQRNNMIADAKKIPLDELAKKVIYGNYVPGVHDTVLIERCEKIARQNAEEICLRGG